MAEVAASSVVPSTLQIALFENASAAVSERLASIVKRRRYGPGTVLFGQNDIGTSLYCVEYGRVRLSIIDRSGHEIILSELDSGSFFGASSLFIDTPYPTCATIVKPTSLLVLHRDCMLSLIRLDPSLALKLLEESCREYRKTLQIIETCLLLKGNARLAKELAVLAEAHGQPAESGNIELRITQSRLGQFLGISRQLVNRYLGNLVEAEIVELNRGGIVITDAAALSRLAEKSA